MSKLTKLLLSVLACGLLAIGSAQAGPPDFVGERGGPPDFGGDGPPFGNGNGNGNGHGNGGGGDDDEEEEDDDFGGGPGNGPPAFCGGDGDGPDGRSGNSHIAHLNFYQFDQDSGDRIEDGPWGRMMYVWSGPTFDFVFNAHELQPEDDFTMTYQPEPTPSPGVVCLGNGIVNEDGDLHIKNSVELNGDLPMPDDESAEGALLVLVYSEDVDCEAGEMLTFLPEDYLFGNALVEYEDTDFEDEDEEDGEDEEEDGDGG